LEDKKSDLIAVSGPTSADHGIVKSKNCHSAI